MSEKLYREDAEIWYEELEPRIFTPRGRAAYTRAEDAERKVRAWDEIAALLAKCVDEFTAALRALEADEADYECKSCGAEVDPLSHLKRCQQCDAWIIEEADGEG